MIKFDAIKVQRALTMLVTAATGIYTSLCINEQVLKLKFIKKKMEYQESKK